MSNTCSIGDAMTLAAEASRCVENIITPNWLIGLRIPRIHSQPLLFLGFVSLARLSRDYRRGYHRDAAAKHPNR